MVDSQISRDIEFASVPENINLIERLVEELKLEFGMSEEMEANVLVSLSEAVNNAIFHGNHMNASKKIKLRIQKEDSMLSFVIEDEGSGFNPEMVKDPTAEENLDKPTGRGIFLMKSLADRVEFFNRGQKVMISFSLP
jgi:serine/threonine-protein kinase RsbW